MLTFTEECAICMERMRNSVICPCHHLVACYECTKVLLNRKDACPICRKDITEVIKVYHSQKKIEENQSHLAGESWLSSWGHFYFSAYIVDSLTGKTLKLQVEYFCCIVKNTLHLVKNELIINKARLTEEITVRSIFIFTVY